MKLSLEQLCKKLSLSYSGNGKLIIDHVCGHNSINSHGIAYCTRKKDLNTIDMPEDAAIVAPSGTIAEGKNLIYSEYPLETHVEIARLFYKPPYAAGAVHPAAVLAQDVFLGRNVTIDANVTIYNNVNIGDNTIIRAGTVIMEGSVIGKDCIIDPNVTICERSNIGNRVIINGGAVIGAADLGFYQKDGIHIRIPQVGQVILEDDVEVGPGTVIDRGRLENTIVRKGCKLDAHVLISHNVDLGQHSMIIGQSAIAGSTKTGHHFTAAGQSGVVGHLRIGDNVTLGARGVITKDTPDNIALAGFPAVPHIRWKRNLIILNRIDS
jgi:UDP-3-O-[3-hydroxymyristoyl] glucosamine N-acyltransferase